VSPEAGQGRLVPMSAIGTKQTFQPMWIYVAIGGKADIVVMGDLRPLMTQSGHYLLHACHPTCIQINNNEMVSTDTAVVTTIADEARCT
jgi:hypothetical protein